MCLSDLIKASHEFEISREEIDRRRRERDDFVSQFPIDSLSDLTLSEYARLGSRSSFTYQLEQKKAAFGIRGGSALKFGIYEGRDHKYYSGQGKSKRELTGDVLQSEFDRLKHGVVKALDCVVKDRVQDINSISMPLWPLVLQKILYFYYPDRFLSIGKKEVLNACAKDLGLGDFDGDDFNLYHLNYLCRKRLQELDEFGGWGSEKLSNFVWTYYDSIDSALFGNSKEIANNDQVVTSFFEELLKFLKQAHTDDLAHAHYMANFMDLTVKVGFGQGTPAFVPWIAFLKSPHTVRDGIYPVYLYYKQKRVLVLSYGVSVTKAPQIRWNLPGLESIDEYFGSKNLGTPERFGNSFVYNVYYVNQNSVDLGLDRKRVNADLSSIVGIYKSMTETPSASDKRSKFGLREFRDRLAQSGLKFADATIMRFVSSLMTKPFVILTGLSGSGKTMLAHSFARWICESDRQYRLVPVGADWTNREPLLGFPNALSAGEYVKPENGVVSLIVEASKPENENRPYFLILDEMNLSHVERYFSDFLSVMESGGAITLHSGEEEWGEVPPKLSFPKNLFIIGTVNIDETTYMFSPKVLDRANVIEFRVTKAEMNEFLNGSVGVDLKKLQSAGAGMAADFVTMARNKDLNVDGLADDVQAALMSFFDELKKAGAEFGYRTASEIKRFAAVARTLDPNWVTNDIIDAAIMQKLLPKVHGSRKKIEDVLKTLIGLCLEDPSKIADYLKKPYEADLSDTKIKYGISYEKLLRMYDNLLNNGFTSYAEA